MVQLWVKTNILVFLASKLKNLLGNRKVKQSIPSEEISRKNARRSIVSTKELKENHTLTESDIISKRPGIGISPIDWDKVIGMKTTRNIKEDHIFTWKDLKNK